MKKSDELKEKRFALYEKMKGIVDKAETEKRSVSETEQTEWDGLDNQIKGLDVEITRALRQEQLDIEFAQRSKPDGKSPEYKLMEKFDLFKAIRAKYSGGQLTGAELEVCQEGVRELRELGQNADERAINIPLSMMQKRAAAEYGTSDGTPPISTIPLNELSIVTTPEILTQLGVTYYQGLTGNVPIPRMGQLTASFANEKAQLTTAGVSLAQNILSPRRVGASDYFTKELLAQTNQSIQSSIWNEFISAIWRAVQKDLFASIGGGATVCTGKTISTTPAVLTWADILLLESSIENNGSMKYLMTHGQKGLLKATEKSSQSAGQFIWGADNAINGYGAFATASIITNGGSTNTAFDVIFGDFKAAVIGSWGGVELLVNPYSKDDYGEIKVTASGLFDTDIANDKKFSVIRNATK
jgi:hypothetical protein